MFDNGNDLKQSSDKQENAKARSSNTEFKRQIIAISIIAGVLIISIIIGAIVVVSRGNMSLLPGGSGSGSQEDTGFLGLKNPGKLTDIEPTTKEDLQEEFQSRPSITENDMANIERRIEGYLNEGSFAELDSYLKEQESYYKGPSGEEAESMEDPTSKFPMMRSDTQIAINMINKSINDPAPQFQVFSSPDILAATVAWVPITMKIDAFLDWSSLVLPPPDAGWSIQMTEYEYEKPNEKLAEIAELTGTQYLDVKSYDMVITGHSVRVTVVMGPTGYWQPFSVQDIGGTLNSNSWTKSFLKNELEPRIHYRSDLDEVCFLSPPDDMPDKDAHPEWFDEDGVYIGPKSEHKPNVIDSPEDGGEEDPQPSDLPAEEETPQSDANALPVETSSLPENE